MSLVVRLLERSVAAGLAIILILIASSLLLLAAGHIHDRWGIDANAGVWMGLAQYARHGTLFPPLYQGGYFGGTRYMPLPVLLDAAASLVTGELSVAVKIVVYLTALLLFVLMYLLLRGCGCGRVIALALICTVAVTSVGIEATTYIRHDALALAFALAALLVIQRRSVNGALIAAGALSTLALASKLDEVWAPAAIVCWLILYQRRGLLAFLGGFLVSLLAAVSVFEALSGGRMIQQLRMFAFLSGGGPGSWPHGAHRLLTLTNNNARPTFFLLPLAALSIALAIRRRSLTILQLGLIAELLILVVVFATPGTASNHLLDLSVLSALVVGEATARVRFHGAAQTALLGPVVSVLLAVLLASAYKQELYPTAAEVAKNILHHRSDPKFTYPLSQYVRPSDRILSDEPNIPTLLGQKPVVLDAFILHYILSEHPAWRADLLNRVRSTEFTKIVLEPGTGARRQLGPAIGNAIELNYVPTATEIGLGIVYTPRPRH